jgi:DNA-binding protein HU-beta
MNPAGSPFLASSKCRLNKLAAEAGSGVNPFKEAMEFVAKLASKSIKASRLKVAKDTV